MKEYSGMDYLRIDIGTHYGLDKLPFEERIAWVHTHEKELESLEYEASEEGDYYRYAAAVMAYRQAKQGLEIGHMVGLDACASGPQLLSVVMGCETGAFNTGATGPDRKDVYSICTDAMNSLLDTDITYSRKQVKSALMPHFYASVNAPKEVFGEDTEELEAFYQATYMVCPGASLFLEQVNNMWDDTALSYSWDLPDGFVVNCKVKKKINTVIEVDTFKPHIRFTYRHTINTVLEKGKFLPANITHSLDGFVMRELTARCNYNTNQLHTVKSLLIERLRKGSNTLGVLLHPEKMWKKHNLLSIEGAEYLNMWTVDQLSAEYCTALLKLIRHILKRPSFELISIHDEFKAHPNNMNYIRHTYIELLCELADSSILDAIFSDICQEKVHVEKLSNNLSELIKKSEYPLA